jgi:hypothetical protein
MSDVKKPNVVGKGPAFTREIIQIFGEIQENIGSLSGDAAKAIGNFAGEKAEELAKVVKMAYLKTVKAGEVSYDLKGRVLNLKEAVGAGDEKEALNLLEQMREDIEHFIHKIKTFVVRMT